MSKKLLEVAKFSIRKLFNKNIFEIKVKEIEDVINFCSVKSINIAEIIKEKLDNT